MNTFSNTIQSASKQLHVEMKNQNPRLKMVVNVTDQFVKFAETLANPMLSQILLNVTFLSTIYLSHGILTVINFTALS